MESATKRSGERRRSSPFLVAAFFIAAFAGGISTIPAWADTRSDHQRQVERRHEREQTEINRINRERERERNRRRWNQPQPYIYAPPPAYYDVPRGPPVIEFVFPFHIR